jgi:streptogramin lyase
MPKLLLCVVLLAALTPARADLLVLHSGASGASAGHVARFDPATGDARRAFGHDNEGMLALAVSAGGDVYVSADILGAGLIYRFDRTGKLVAKLADVAGTDFRALAFARDGSLWALASVVDASDPSVRRTHLVRFSGDDRLVHLPAGESTEPRALAVGADGDLYVADASAGVLRFDGATGAFRGALGTPGASALAFGPDGKLYVASATTANAVLRFDAATGAFLDTFVVAGTAARGLAFGPDGNLFVASAGEVLRFDGRSGAFLGVFVARRPGEVPAALAFL